MARNVVLGVCTKVRRGRGFLWVVGACLTFSCFSAGSGSDDAGAGVPSGGTSASGGSGACERGSEGCSCYGNGTCDGALVCASELCVNLDGSGGAGDGGGSGSASGGTDAGGAGNASGASGSGAAGSGGAGTDLFCTPATVIDDLEDGDNQACPNSGRVGGWYVFKPESASMTSPTANTLFDAYSLGTDARAGSEYGIRFSGSGFTTTDPNHYAVLGVGIGDQTPYDASGHLGLRFWAKSKAGALKLRVNVTTVASRYSESGGTCTADCEDYYGEYVDLTTTWQEFSINFTYLQQAGWGATVDKDLAHVLTIEFVYAINPYNPVDPGSPYTNPSSFDFLIDDISFQ